MAKGLQVVTEAEEQESTADDEAIDEIDDDDEESYNDDSEYPLTDWELEWSPWCEDTENITLCEFLRNNLNLTRFNKEEKETALSILQLENDKKAREAIRACTFNMLKRKLYSLVEIYDFNQYSQEFERDILPDVIIRREKQGNEWNFPIEVPIDSDNTKNDELEDWVNTLKNFTEILRRNIPEFFSAVDFDSAIECRNKKLKNKGWTQISLAKKWYRNDFKKESPFSVDLKYQIDMDNSIISEQLRHEFENNKIKLSQNVTVSTEAKGIRWLISDKEEKREYHIKKERGKINIYEEKGKKVHSLETIISNIKNYRFIQVDFFDQRVLSFAFFFNEWVGV